MIVKEDNRMLLLQEKYVFVKRKYVHINKNASVASFIILSVSFDRFIPFQSNKRHCGQISNMN